MKENKRREILADIKRRYAAMDTEPELLDHYLETHKSEVQELIRDGYINTDLISLTGNMELHINRSMTKSPLTEKGDREAALPSTSFLEAPLPETEEQLIEHIDYLHTRLGDGGGRDNDLRIGVEDRIKRAEKRLQLKFRKRDVRREWTIGILSFLAGVVAATAAILTLIQG